MEYRICVFVLDTLNMWRDRYIAEHGVKVGAEGSYLGAIEDAIECMHRLKRYF